MFWISSASLAVAHGNAKRWIACSTEFGPAAARCSFSPAKQALAGGYGETDARSVATRIERSFQHQALALRHDTRLLLRAAAAEPLGDLALLWRAAERLGTSTDAIAPAEAAELVELRDGRMYFQHPLAAAGGRATVRASPLHSGTTVALHVECIAEPTDAIPPISERLERDAESAGLVRMQLLVHEQIR